MSKTAALSHDGTQSTGSLANTLLTLLVGLTLGIALTLCVGRIADNNGRGIQSRKTLDITTPVPPACPRNEVVKIIEREVRVPVHETPVTNDPAQMRFLSMNEEDCSTAEAHELVYQTIMGITDPEIKKYILRTIQNALAPKIYDHIKNLESHKAKCYVTELPYKDEVYTGPTGPAEEYMDNSTLLHWAVYHGADNWAEAFVHSGAKTNLTNAGGYTPTHLGAKQGSTFIEKVMLSTDKVDIEDKDSKIETPLCLAADEGHVSVVGFLLSQGASTEDRCGENDSAPLHIACREGHVPVIQTLIDGGADVDAKDKDGATPLSKAAEGGHDDAVSILLDSGAALNATTVTGHTALHAAAEKCQVKTAEILVKKGLSKTAALSTGETPLDLADGKCKCDQAVIDALLTP